MSNPCVEQLENIISAYVNNIYKEIPPTEEEFIEKATLLRDANAQIMPVSDDEFEEIMARLKESLVIQMDVNIPEDIENYLITIDEQKVAQRSAKKEQKVVNEIQIQTTVVNYPVEMWKKLSEFVVKNHMVTPTDVSALTIACQMPLKIPNTYQCKRLLALLRKASTEGFNIEV